MKKNWLDVLLYVVLGFLAALALLVRLNRS